MVEEVKLTVPVVADLRSGSLTKRHWESLVSVLGTNIRAHGPTTFKQIMEVWQLTFVQEAEVLVSYLLCVSFSQGCARAERVRAVFVPLRQSHARILYQVRPLLLKCHRHKFFGKCEWFHGFDEFRRAAPGLTPVACASPAQFNVKDVADRVNAVVTDAEEESLLAELLRKASISVNILIYSLHNERMRTA